MSCTLSLHLLWLIFAPTAQSAEPARPLSYNRDIRPILSEACFHCHGFDKNTRQGDLRLDERAAAIARREGTPAILPGKPADSELVTRILAHDPDERMPPISSARTLSPAQIELLKQWIAEGAEYEPHWALTPPKRLALPEVKQPDWPAGPIDHWVLARLEREGLRPSPEAKKQTLLRRVSLDLTGLPPTPAELAAFLSDESPAAFEKVVDRLLASPRYGERMASLWLDAARYADTNGYQTDGPRQMWRWRDWVIDAFNSNLSFDQFTIDQLAGDLLPQPTLDQQIATGFNRNHRTNSEGGIIPEEYRVEYVVDRVDTTSTLWLGMTLGCARCHDHKYDPVTQREFYRLFAFFNNVPEQGKGVRDSNSAPFIKAPTPAMAARLAESQAVVDQASRLALAQLPALIRALEEWEKQPDAAKRTLAEPLTEKLLVHIPFEKDAPQAVPVVGDKPGEEAGGKLPVLAVGRVGQAAEFDGQSRYTAGDAGTLIDTEKFSFAAWTRAEGDGSILSRMDDEIAFVGYDLRWEKGRLQMNLVGRILDDSIRVETVKKWEFGAWHHVAGTYDGSRTAAGVRLFVDGTPQEVHVIADTLSNPIKTTQPLRIGSRRSSGFFRGLIDDVRIYARMLELDDIQILACGETAAEILALPRDQRTPQQARKLARAFLEHAAPKELRETHAALATARQEHATLLANVPTVMVMFEMNPPRETRLLLRGEYDKPGEIVTPGVPASLPPLSGETPSPSTSSPNRLDLARWLVDPKHPLTARVTVNRYWQQLFGAGLVKTTEDFGSQGEAPSHPELLDWLAMEFIGQRWNVKGLLKTIVMSRTYRQDSQVSPELLRRDPANRLLARGPRFRLSAEMIRDQALAASGLLVEKRGGPSARPYQPEGLWLELAASAVNYEQDHGDNLYRRSLYTYWKRTVAPPSMMALDASSRDMCTVRQSRTNTPLQALTLLNDVTFVETSRKLAERALRDGGPTPEGRIAHAMRLLLAREPSATELRVLVAGLTRHRARFARAPDSAAQYVSAGESPRDKSLDVIELAAYTALAGVLLNLDETVTKE